MKKIINLLVLLFLSICSYGQSYNTSNVALANYLTRMYKAEPFEGVKVADDYDNHYLISVVALDSNKYANNSAMARVASVKAMSQASRFLNGASITSDMFIRTSEKSDGSGDTEIIENIHEHSVGYVNALALLTNFVRETDGWNVFIYFKKIDR